MIVFCFYLNIYGGSVVLFLPPTKLEEGYVFIVLVCAFVDLRVCLSATIQNKNYERIVLKLATECLSRSNDPLDVNGDPDQSLFKML